MTTIKELICAKAKELKKHGGSSYAGMIAGMIFDRYVEIRLSYDDFNDLDNYEIRKKKGAT
jgi:hypothetical protein